MTIADTRTRWLALIVLCLGRPDDRARHDDRERGAAVDPGGPRLLGESLAWVVNAYLLTFGGFLLLGGRLGDLVGHRRMFLAGIALFTARLDRAAASPSSQGAPGRGARGAGRSAARSSRRSRSR